MICQFKQHFMSMNLKSEVLKKKVSSLDQWHAQTTNAMHRNSLRELYNDKTNLIPEIL